MVQTWFSIASQGHHTHLYRMIPPNLQSTEEKAARACTLQETPFVTRASPYGQTPSIAPLEYDNHLSTVTWREEANNIPRRWIPVPTGAPRRKPHRNRVVGTHHIFTEGERYGFERRRPTTRRSPAAAEVGDARLAGGEPKRPLKCKQSHHYWLADKSGVL